MYLDPWVSEWAVFQLYVSCPFHWSVFFSSPAFEDVSLVQALKAIDEDSDDGTVFYDVKGRGLYREGEVRLRPRLRGEKIRGMAMHYPIEGAIRGSISREYVGIS